jgi:AcrR family transcriptional regulator
VTPPAATAAPPAADGKRERTKAANRAAILGAGREVFAQLGYGAATVRDIARRTGLATGTFYNYFPDKESVFRALLSEVAAGARARVQAARRRATTLDQFVEEGYRAYFEFLAEDRATFELTRRNAGTIRTLFDEPSVGAGAEELRADLDDAVARGLTPALDSEYMAAAMVGTGFELGVRMLERDPPDIEGATRFATALFLGGIGRLCGDGAQPSPSGAV